MSNRLGPRTRLLGSGASARVSQWLLRSQVKSIQRGVIAIASASAANTGAITAVVMANSRLRLLGTLSDSAGGTPSADNVVLELTDATTITAGRSATGVSNVVTSYEIIEYWPGVIKRVQRGVITISGAATNTAAITTVNTAKSELDYLGCRVDADLDSLEAYATLTNATTVTATRNSAAGNTSLMNYQVVEWF